MNNTIDELRAMVDKESWEEMIKTAIESLPDYHLISMQSWLVAHERGEAGWHCGRPVLRVDGRVTPVGIYMGRGN